MRFALLGKPLLCILFTLLFIAAIVAIPLFDRSITALAGQPRKTEKPKAAPKAPKKNAAHIQPERRKYNHLLRRIEVKQDRARYGDFYDWGYWAGKSWAGHTDLPPGYWVYLAPDWCIFESATGAKPPHNPRMPGKHKYGKLLRRIKVADDAKAYGDYHDFGYYKATSYKSFKDLPAGYWVYAAPYWYIFDKPSPEDKKRFDPRQDLTT